MTTQWLSEAVAGEELILAGDIGGTNTSFALVGRTGTKFTVFAKFLFSSRRLHGLENPIRQVLEEIRDRTSLRPEKCCLSGAGPVKDNTCVLTNLEWTIDGNMIARNLGLPTVVINDFTAVSYGITLLDTEDPAQILKLPHSDGSFPEPHGSVRAVVGAGTGLGVGYLAEIGGKYVAYASEGGHSSFAPFDTETRELQVFLEGRYGMTPGAEEYVSGQGIANIYRFFREGRRFPDSPAVREIDAMPESDRPAMIALHAKDDECCARVMKLFIMMYGRFASNAALFYFPTGGLYIAGGIATKNAELFLEDGLFMSQFEANYREHISGVLTTFPVYLVRDYGVSLYGAAQAAHSLL